MSDQPTPTGEWTGDYVANKFKINAWDVCDKISDAHNAALSASQKALSEEVDCVHKTLNQLAAYKQQAESMLATSKRVNDQLREQLAAERERYLNEARHVYEMEKELAAERELLEQGITAGADWDWHNRVKAALAKVKEGK